MKVLMTADTVGGVWTYAVTLCRALQAHGVKVALATMGREMSDLQRAQVSLLSNVTVHESAYRLCWMADSEQDVAAAGRWLLQLEQQLQPDVVHLNDLGHGNLPWQTPALLVMHSCVYSWWHAVMHQAPPAPDWQSYHDLVTAGLENVRQIIAPTQAMLNALQEHYAVGDANTTVVSNGRDFPRLVPDPHTNSQKQPLLFCAGRIWDDAKNLRQVAEVAEQLPWPVFIAGEQKDPNGGAQELANIHPLGFLDDPQMSLWLHCAAIYVAPAKYEPFGLAILEAARAGCALVLGDIASLREVWGDAAIYVDPDSPQALRAAVRSLIDRPEYRHRLAHAAWQRAQYFSAARMAEAYFEQYQLLTHRLPAASSPPPNAIAGAHS